MFGIGTSTRIFHSQRETKEGPGRTTSLSGSIREVCGTRNYFCWVPCRCPGCFHTRKKKPQRTYAPGSQVLSCPPALSPLRIILLFQACTSVKRLECGFLYGVQSCLREGPSASLAPAHISLEASRKLWERAILSGDGAMRYDRGLLERIRLCCSSSCPPQTINPLDGSPKISMVGLSSRRSAGSAAGQGAQLQLHRSETHRKEQPSAELEESRPGPKPF